MSNGNSDRFFVSFLGPEDKITSVSTFFEEEDHGLKFLETNKDVKATSSEVSDQPEFQILIDNFRNTLDLFMKFIPLTIQIMPQLFEAVLNTGIVPYVKKNGKFRADLSSEEKATYELENKFLTRLERMKENLTTSNEGTRLLPEIMIIGLISSYDFFLSELIRHVLKIHPEIVLTGDKSIKLSDLKLYENIAEAQESIIRKEVETVIRGSHHEQFDWMQQKFSLPLKDNLTIWPKFVEICERRNLLTHTGGVVSHQYLKNCKDHKVDVSKIKVGDKLDVSPAYFIESVRIIFEIGVKLGHVLWRKFLPNEREQADTNLIQMCYNLTVQREFELAEALLRFAIETLKRHHSDALRRTFIINLASVRMQLEDKEGARKILDREDWSAANDRFAISVAAIKGDLDDVLTIMSRIGKDGQIDAEDYRDWPLFSDMRREDRFNEVFRSIFGENLKIDAKIRIEEESISNNNETNQGADVS